MLVRENWGDEVFQQKLLKKNKKQLGYRKIYVMHLEKR